MTKDSLKQIIKEMVQQEIQESLPKLLSQVLAEAFAAKSEPTSTTVKTNKPVNKTVVAIQSPTGKQPMKVFTKNEKLNKALNETVMSIPSEGSVVSPGLGTMPSVMDHVDKVPASVATALTKNYSSLMKAIDKKRSSGIGNTGVVGMM